MKIYYIRTFANEDQPETTVGYTYDQYNEVIEMLKKNHTPYKSWVERIIL